MKKLLIILLIIILSLFTLFGEYTVGYWIYCGCCVGGGGNNDWCWCNWWAVVVVVVVGYWAIFCPLFNGNLIVDGCDCVKPIDDECCLFW